MAEYVKSTLAELPTDASVPSGAKGWVTTGDKIYEWDGDSWVLKSIAGAALVTDGALATNIVSSGGNTYIAEAVCGADATAAVWRAQKIDSTGSVTWADGNGNFDNTPGAAGASLSGLTYS